MFLLCFPEQIAGRRSDNLNPGIVFDGTDESEQEVEARIPKVSLLFTRFFSIIFRFKLSLFSVIKMINRVKLGLIGYFSKIDSSIPACMYIHLRFEYRISANSFRGNCFFLKVGNVEIFTYIVIMTLFYFIN